MCPIQETTPPNSQAEVSPSSFSIQKLHTLGFDATYHHGSEGSNGSKTEKDHCWWD